MQAMATRVRDVAAGALPPHVRVDVPRLLEEHNARASVSGLNFGPPPVPTRWDMVRRALKTIYA